MKSLFAIIAIIAITALLSSCATDTGDVTKDRRDRVTNAILSAVGKAVASAAVSTLTNAATQQMNGSKVDLAQAASQGLWTNVGSIANSDSLEKVINAWSGGAIKPIAAVAAQKFNEAHPVTPEDKKQVVATIANAITKATQ